MTGAERQRAYRASHPDLVRRRTRDAVRAQYDKRRSAIAMYKLERGCADCGDAWQASVGENPDALQFDHVRGEKVDTVPKLLTKSFEAALDEMDKCEVRCANCHAIRTNEMMRQRYNHRHQDAA